MPDILPPPDPQAASASEQLTDLIRAEIAASGGWLDFERYMELALYSPGLGYYSAGSVKLGPRGDFTTAPELSSIFGSVIAGQIHGMLADLVTPVILEVGAGTGSLAKSILDEFAQDGGPIPDYWILELSADLKERQRECLTAYEGHIRWLAYSRVQRMVHSWFYTGSERKRGCICAVWKGCWSRDGGDNWRYCRSHADIRSICGVV